MQILKRTITTAKAAITKLIILKNYKNPILKGSNVYESEKLSAGDIKKYHLVKYGEMSVYGTARDKDDAWELSSKLDDYNCWFREKNIKLNFILLKNAKSTEAMFWQQYWQNGNNGWNSFPVYIPRGRPWHGFPGNRPSRRRRSCRNSRRYMTDTCPNIPRSVLPPDPALRDCRIPVER